MNRFVEQPPPIVRQRIDDLRRLEPSVSLVTGVLRVVDATPQVPPSTIARSAMVAVAATALVASIAVFAFLMGSQSTPVGPQPSARASGSPAAATPVPVNELPIAGSLEARLPLNDGDILVMGAFDAAWLTNGMSGLVTRISGDESIAYFEARPPVAGRGRLWVAAGSDRVWAGAGAASGLVGIDPETGEVLDTIAVDAFPFMVAADETEAWVTDDMRNVVVGVDLVRQTVSHRIFLSGPHGLALTARSVWVTSSVSNTVVEIDRASGEIVRSIDVGPTPMQVIATPDESTLIVLGRDGMQITAVDVLSGEVRRGSREVAALTFAGDTPWAMLPAGPYIGPIDLETLEFTGVYQLPSAFCEGLVYAAGSLWTTDANELFRVAPDP